MDLSCAFQPIVDVNENKVFSYEALVRGKNNESASYVFSQIPKEDLLIFDQQAKKIAIALAAKLKIGCYINLNFLPCTLQSTGSYISEILEFAEQHHLARNQIIVEVTEEEVISDPQNFSRFINKYRATGIKVAIDDFGAGYAGLNLLVDFLPDIIKLDINLIRNIHNHGSRQAIVKAILQICIDLGIDVIAEGIETLDEYYWLKSHNIKFFQGFLFAKPGFESLPLVFYPDLLV